MDLELAKLFTVLIAHSTISPEDGAVLPLVLYYKSLTDYPEP